MTAYRLQTQRGFGYIAALILLVVLAGLAAGLVRLSTTQQTTSSLDLSSARAYQAAGAGVQWALFNALTTSNCPNGELDLRSATGFHVTVTCTIIPFNEGESSPGTELKKTLFSISAVACNSGASCPDNANAAAQNYVERRRVATACVANTSPLSAC